MNKDIYNIITAWTAILYFLLLYNDFLAVWPSVVQSVEAKFVAWQTPMILCTVEGTPQKWISNFWNQRAKKRRKPEFRNIPAVEVEATKTTTATKKRATSWFCEFSVLFSFIDWRCSGMPTLSSSPHHHFPSSSHLKTILSKNIYKAGFLFFLFFFFSKPQPRPSYSATKKAAALIAKITHSSLSAHYFGKVRCLEMCTNKAVLCVCVCVCMCARARICARMSYMFYHKYPCIYRGHTRKFIHSCTMSYTLQWRSIIQESILLFQ